MPSAWSTTSARPNFQTTDQRDAGVSVHRRSLEPRDVCRKHGIPTTNVPRTIIDCAQDVGLEGTEELIWAADSKRTLDRRRLEELAGRPLHPRSDQATA
jgi:hypothetical protein